MSVEILLPRVGSADEGLLIEWRAGEGEHVTEGEPLAKFDAGGSSEEIEAPATGTLTILARTGLNHKVGALLGYID